MAHENAPQDSSVVKSGGEMGRAGAKSKASAEARPQSAFVGGPDASWRDDAPAGAAGADRSFGGESPVRQLRSPTVSIRSKGGALLSPPGWVGGEDDIGEARGSERNFREFMINQRAAAVYKDTLHKVVAGQNNLVERSRDTGRG